MVAFNQRTDSGKIRRLRPPAHRIRNQVPVQASYPGVLSPLVSSAPPKTLGGNRCSIVKDPGAIGKRGSWEKISRWQRQNS